MANLFDGIRKSDKSEIAKLFCDFKVYNMPVILHIVWQCIYYALRYVLRQMARLFKKELSLPPVNFWKKRHEILYESCMQQEKEVLLVALFHRVKKKMRLVGVHVTKSEDKISAEITGIVSGLYRKADLKGLSVAEKNDYICKKYPRQKKLDQGMCLRLWLIVSAFVLVATGIFFLFWEELRVITGAICILIEMLWGYWIYRKLLQWQLARLVWISGNGLGQPFSMTSKATMKFPEGQNKEACESDFWIYHTLCSMAKEASEERRPLLEDIVTVRGLFEKDKLKQRWEKCFRKLEFRSEVFSQAVNQFAFGDFEKLEQRFAELSDAGDPVALAERRKNSYTMSLRTGRGDIAYIYFTASKNPNKRLCVSGLERKGTLKMVPMAEDKLRVLLGKEDNRIGELYQEYLNTIIPKEKKVASAQQNTKRLEGRIAEAESLKQLKEADLLKLKKQITERERECEEIHGRLSKKGLSDAYYEEQKQAFLKAQRQLSSLKEDYKFCEKRYEEVKDAYDTVVSRKEVQLKEISELSSQIKELRRKFSGALADSVKEKKKSGQRDADYLLGELLIKKLSI